MVEVHNIGDTQEDLQEFVRTLSREKPAGQVAAPQPRTGPAPRGDARRPSRPATAPWVAASCSVLVWGGGQWVNGQTSLAMLFLSLQVLAGAVAYCVSQTWGSLVGLGRVFFVEEATMRGFMLVASAGVPLVGVAAIIQAYGHAARRWRGRRFSGHPVVPAAASLLLPGWGQLVNEQMGKAAVFLVAGCGSVYLVLASRLQPGSWASLDPTGRVPGTPFSAAVLAVAIVAVLTWALAVYDAFLTAVHLRS